MLFFFKFERKVTMKKPFPDFKTPKDTPATLNCFCDIVLSEKNNFLETTLFLTCLNILKINLSDSISQHLKAKQNNHKISATSEWIMN